MALNCDLGLNHDTELAAPAVERATGGELMTLPGCWTYGKICWHVPTDYVDQARVNRADTLRALATLLEGVGKSQISEFLTLTVLLPNLGFSLLTCSPSVVTGMVHFPALARLHRGKLHLGMS